MNDTYGSDPHDHDGQDEAQTQGEEAIHEAPPPYEFAADEESEITTEQSEAPDVKAVRRSPILPIAAALGGVVLLGAVAWWQFGGSSSPAFPPPGNTHAPAALSLQALPGQGQAPTASSIDSGPVAPKTGAAMPQDTSAALPAPALNAPDIAAQPTKPTDNSAFKPGVVVTAPPVAPVPAPVLSVAALPAAPVSVVPAQNPASGASDHRIETLTARVDSLQKALDQANQQLAQMSVPAAPPVKDLQDRIDKLEQEIATMHTAQAPVAAEMPASEPEAVPAPKARPVAHTPKHKTVAHKAAKKTVASAANNWVLRAASPGQAWVAPSPASHELKQVQVGDTLPGIGRVTAIQQKGDNWVIQGTKGAIQ